MKLTRLIIPLLLASIVISAKGKYSSEFNSHIKEIPPQKVYQESMVPYYDLETQLYYGFYNDDTFLYILVQTNNADMAQNITKQGAKLIISGKYGEKVTGSFAYSPHQMQGDRNKSTPPKMDGNQQFPVEGRSPSSKGSLNMEKNGAKSRSDLNDSRKHFTLEHGMFTADGFRLTNGILIMDKPVELHAETSWPEDRFLKLYFQIPLTELAIAPLNWKKLTKKGFKVRFEVQASKSSGASGVSMQNQNSGEMGGPPSGGSQGGPPSGMQGGPGGGMGEPPSGGMTGGSQGGSNTTQESKLKFYAKVLLASSAHVDE